MMNRSESVTIESGRLVLNELKANPRVSCYWIELKARYWMKWPCGHVAESTVVSHEGKNPLESYRVFQEKGLRELDTAFAQRQCRECAQARARAETLRERSKSELDMLDAQIAKAQSARALLLRVTAAIKSAKKPSRKKRQRRSK